MQLSNNFRLSEFTRSDTAKRLGWIHVSAKRLKPEPKSKRANEK